MLCLGMLLKHLTELASGSAGRSAVGVDIGTIVTGESMPSATASAASSSSSTADHVEQSEPPNKKTKTAASVFGYSNSVNTSAVSSNNGSRPSDTPASQLTKYLTAIADINFDVFDSDERMKMLSDYKLLRPLFNRIFCVPATSAPVERIFSHSGIIMRPHRARMSDELLETLMFLKCNQLVNY